MLKRWLGTAAKEEGSCVLVREIGHKLGDSRGVGCGRFEKESVCKVGGSNGLAQITDATGDFRVWKQGGVTCFDVVQSLDEGQRVRCWGHLSDRDAGGGGEDFGFSKI